MDKNVTTGGGMRRALTVLAAACALGAAGTATASADEGQDAAAGPIAEMHQGHDYGSVERDTRDFLICDNEADGRKVYIWFEWADGAARGYSDANGSKPGCGTGEVYTGGLREVSVCETIDWWPDACTTKKVKW
ncbi:hypothetical protein [Amycolatopsis sp. NPDC049868]|uniref:hypothetical protein n=1 Tax=Amycolatopsis sp. NPDC049868 TaxID=3363934 RepID=UPI0037B42CEB